jgi:hypothetical protein
VPSPMPESQAASQVAQWDKLRSCTDLTP